MSQAADTSYRKPSPEDYGWQPQVCPICEVAPNRFLGRRGGAAHRSRSGVECEIWRCVRCVLILANPMPFPIGGHGKHYDVEAVDYFQHHDRDSKDEAAHSFLTQASLLCGKKGRLLDIGVGRGELLRAAAEDGWDPLGVEPAATFAAYAAKHSGVEVIPKSIEQCTFENAWFDVVVLSGVLEHLYHPNETISEVARILRLGGILFVDVPNEAGLYFRLGNLYERLRGRDWVVNLA